MKYDYPLETFDFTRWEPVAHPNMRALEEDIRRKLTSDDSRTVRDGLSNVVYWAYLSDKRQKHRAQQFRREVTDEQVQHVMGLLANLNRQKVRLQDVTTLGLPVFSGVSVTSKMLMFFDPTGYVVLDRNIANLKGKTEIFDGLPWKSNSGQTQIPVTEKSQRIYDLWCALCRKAAETYFSHELIAVDIERAIWQLARTGYLDDAAELVNSF